MNDRATEKLSLYAETARLIQERIASGVYPLGSVLPREVDLSAELHVSRNTVRSALTILEESGLVERKRRAGTRVVSRHRSQTAAIDISSIEGIRQYIRNTTATIVERTYQSLPKDLQEIAGISVDEPWPSVAALRRSYSGGDPIAAIDFHVHPDHEGVFAHYGVTNDLLYRNIEREHGIQVERIDVVLRPGLVGERWSGPLECDADLPAIEMIEVIRTTDGQVLEVAFMVVPRGRLEFAFSVYNQMI